MSSPRFLTWFVAIYAFAIGQLACVAAPPVWQPYREAALPSSAHRVIPAQRATTLSPVTTYVEPSIPMDAITDVELNQLRGSFEDTSPFTPATTYTDSLFDPVTGAPLLLNAARPHQLELLPSDVIWHSYWAGARESRISGLIFEEFGDDLTLLDATLGGRAALLRDAVRDEQGYWYGWELQIEGAAILRLNFDEDLDFDAADFRFGVPLIVARGPVQYKFAYYHLSSHVGDEFLERNPGFTRINFSRDVLLAGMSYFPDPALRLYGETGLAFVRDGGSEPLEFQFGFDYAQPGFTGLQGTPFLAFNVHLREEVDYGGNFAIQVGQLWRGQSGRIIRTGLHYYNGKSAQFEFFDQFEQQLGVGLWYEF